MQAYVYKSQRKHDTYLYLAARDDFGRVPDALLTPLGALQFVLEVALTPERKLVTQDAAVVRENLAIRGFHLQFPPADGRDPSFDPSPSSGLRISGIKDDDWGTDA